MIQKGLFLSGVCDGARRYKKDEATDRIGGRIWVTKSDILIEKSWMLDGIWRSG